MNVPDAVETLCSELRKDPEFYYAYQANIAMAFKDEWDKVQPIGGVKGSSDLIHAVANNAAKNFLDLLISQALKHP